MELKRKEGVGLGTGTGIDKGNAQALIATPFASLGPDVVRAACLQNETAPEKLLTRYEKRFEKCEKGSENDPKRV